MNARIDIPIAVSLERWVTLSGEWPITWEEWERMLTILETMRPGLVESKPILAHP